MRYIPFLTLLIATSCFGWGSNAPSMFVSGTSIPSEPSSTHCVGWANTLCIPDAEPSSSVIFSTDGSWFRNSWTAPESGTIRAVHFKSGDSTNPQNYIGLGVWKNVAGTWTLICHGDEVLDLDSSTWYRTATATGACTFSAGDELRFGISVDYTSSFSFRRGTNTSNPAYYYYASAIPGTPPATVTMTTSGSNYDLAFMMEYTND